MNLIPFAFDGANIRVQVDDGVAWFCAKDVCDALGYARSADAVAQHAKPGGTAKLRTLTQGGSQDLLYVNESNLYRLVMRSKVEGAERFQDWVTNEVLPAIRKTGAYARQPADDRTVPVDFEGALLLAAELEGERKRLVALVENQKPKAEAHDRFLDTTQTFTLTHLAKACGTTVITMNRWLRERGYIHRHHKDNVPNDKGVAKGLLVVVNRGYKVVSEDEGTEERTRPQTRVTPLGMSVLSNEYAALHSKNALRLVGGAT